ncbi:hypothetical protein TPE_1399 [Treponema pedis str. T A4]|uniref:Uncharacterized protein n=1 Tax=Treponema pedis str. T A4 TaxID=1291379 RepID=S6A8I6_9SPIR|nr:hypothetical protein TPE_1399 [Treponema pedis str. T A4]
MGVFLTARSAEGAKGFGVPCFASPQLFFACSASFAVLF